MNQKISQIKVHEIIDEYCKDDSKELNMDEKAAEAKQSGRP